MAEFDSKPAPVTSWGLRFQFTKTCSLREWSAHPTTHSLAGALLGAIGSLLTKVNILAHAWFGRPTPSLLDTDPLSLAGVKEIFAVALEQHVSSIYLSLFILLMLLLCRILLRSQRRAMIGVGVIFTIYMILAGQSEFAIALLPMGLISASYLLLMVRFGFLSLVTAFSVYVPANSFPIAPDADKWYFGHGMFVVGLFAVIALYGFYTSLGGRTVFRDPLAQRT